MIIANYIEKIKRGLQKAVYLLSQKDTLISLIILATGTSAFSLGYFAGKDASRNSPKILFTESNRVPTAAASGLLFATGNQEVAQDGTGKTKSTIFGSKSGTKYYYSWCKSGNRVKLENRVYFESSVHAEKVGRTLAANCK